MPSFEFEALTVKRRKFELEAKNLEEARKMLEDTIKKENGNDDDEYWEIWDTIYSGDVVKDEIIVEVKYDGKPFIKKGEVVWKG